MRQRQCSNRMLDEHHPERIHTRTRSRKDCVVMFPILLLSLYNTLDIYNRNMNGDFVRKLINALSGGSSKNSQRQQDEGRERTVEENDENSIDIMSVGSVLKEAFQDAQQRTFGSHTSIRNFFRVTEMSDTDRECFTQITTDQLQDIIDFCGNVTGQSQIAATFRNNLFKPKKHAGWMCAQKRPIDGLHYVLKQYKNGMPLPKYLFIIDDDTFINIDSLMQILNEKFHYKTPYLVAGCNYDYLQPVIPFPYGGFGSFITRAALKHMIKPIYCDDASERNETVINDPFNRLSCWRLKRNMLGEKEFFKDGMSVSDLMYAYAAEQPFPKVASWTAGYCFHSDHALSYFLNFYHIAVPDEKLNDPKYFVLREKIRKQYKYTELTDQPSRGSKGECQNERDQCQPDSHVCHYIQPEQMDELYAKQIQMKNQDTKKIELQLQSQYYNNGEKGTTAES